MDAELWRVSNLSPFKLDDVSMKGHIRSSVSLEVMVYMEVYNKIFNTDVLTTLLKTAAKHLRGVRINGCTMKREGDSDPLDDPRLNLSFLDLSNTRGDFNFLATLLIQSSSKINALGNYYKSLEQKQRYR